MDSTARCVRLMLFSIVRNGELILSIKEKIVWILAISHHLSLHILAGFLFRLIRVFLVLRIAGVNKRLHLRREGGKFVW